MHTAASLSGIVTDPGSVAVLNGKVTATAQLAGVATIGETNSEGYFVLRISVPRT
jgi:hypothetical protein